MIDYSVYLLTNTLNPDEPAKAYGVNQVREVWPLEKFSKHIADHNGVYSRGTVKGVISDMCECLVEQLLNGNKIKLGELGTFGISLKTEGAESKEKFTSANIKAVNIVFTPGDDFENLISQCEFNVVASRVAQAATLKAEMSGAMVVDLAAARAASGSSTTSGSGDDSSQTSGADSSQTSGADSGQTSGADSGQTSGGSSTTPSGDSGTGED